MKQKRQILLDHKLVGKKLVPPIFDLLQISEGKFIESSYVNNVLPEIFWQAILNEKYGVPTATRVTLTLLKEIEREGGVDKSKLFCFISNFELLNKSQIERILERLSSNADFKLLIDAILPFIRVFPQCPLKVLCSDSLNEYSAEDLSIVKLILSELLDKISRQATLAQASIIHYSFQMNLFAVQKDSTLTQLNDIQFYPLTDKSKIIASQVRATINFFIKNEAYIQINNSWQEYFWVHACKLEPNNITELYYD